VGMHLLQLDDMEVDDMEVDDWEADRGLPFMALPEAGGGGEEGWAFRPC